MKMLEITPKLLAYVNNINPKENIYLSALREKTDMLKYSRLRSPQEQVAFIIFLIQLRKPLSILEIGTFTGYTTLAMALYSGQDTAITTCDINNIFPKVGQAIWKESGVSSKIDLVLGPALESLTQFSNQRKTFDLIYIDADKENNSAYLDKALTIINNDGIILVDNIFWHGSVIDDNLDDRAKAIDHFNKSLNERKNINHSVLTIGDGLLLISKVRD